MRTRSWKASNPKLDSTTAAIDVGSQQLQASIAGGPPKIIGATTGQRHELWDWLKAQGIKTVAMEATGVYWLCPYEVLEKTGSQVVVVNSKLSRTWPDAKPREGLPEADDPACSRLLKPGLVPPEHIRRLQDYIRLHTDYITKAASHKQYMQKALADPTGGLKASVAGWWLTWRGSANWPSCVLALDDPRHHLCGTRTQKK